MARRWLVALAFVAPFVAVGVLHPDPGGTFAELWLVTPIAFCGAVFANATAIGGGFLFVPVFVFAYGLNPITALKLSLGTQAVGMSSGALGWSNGFIARRALVTGCSGALIGMVLGTLVWTPTPLDVKWSFGWVSILIGVAMFLEYRYGKHEGADDIPAADLTTGAAYVLVCVAGGLVTAWVSIGIGEVVALWLLFRHRIRIEKAIGTGVAALAVCSIAGLLLHAPQSSPPFPWVYLAFTAPGVLLGGFTGARSGAFLERWMRERGRRSPLKAIFTVVVLLDGIVMLLHAVAVA